MLEASFEGRVVPWVISYEYFSGDSFPSYLPRKISGFAIHNGKRSLQFEVGFLRLQTSEQLLPEESFMPDTLLNGVSREIMLTTNGPFSRRVLNDPQTSMTERIGSALKNGRTSED